MKEVVCIHIGQAGVQMGNSLWELLTVEHGVNEIGNLLGDSYEIECLETFFSLSQSSQYVPRTIFVDLEATVIDEVRVGRYRDLFHPSRLITGPEDAASNFARGFFTVGKLLLGVVTNELKKLLESGDNTQAIFIFRSLGGGTGSGLTSAIFDCLTEYGKLVKIEMPVYPSPTLSTAMVEPYNCLLSEHFCMEDIDIGLLLDNEALYDICTKYLSVGYPTYSTINRIVSQLTSSITASIRFENILNCDLSVLQTNLVPYPRIHFPLANFAPVLCASKALHDEVTVAELTKAVFEKDNQLMKIDHSFGRFMSCSLFYRGEISPYHVYLALGDVKKDKHIEFVEWCPTGFKVGINVKPPTIVPASEIYQTSKNLTMLANTSAIGQAWQRLTHKFYLLYSKRSFVHWYVGEGMEECEFTESLYNISALVKDYEEVTQDRFEEESSANADTTPEVPIDSNVPQTNTAFAEVDHKNDHMNPDERKTSIKKNTKHEEHFATEIDINEQTDDESQEQQLANNGQQTTKEKQHSVEEVKQQSLKEEKEEVKEKHKSAEELVELVEEKPQAKENAHYKIEEEEVSEEKQEAEDEEQQVEEREDDKDKEETVEEAGPNVTVEEEQPIVNVDEEDDEVTGEQEDDERVVNAEEDDDEDEVSGEEEEVIAVEEEEEVVNVEEEEEETDEEENQNFNFIDNLEMSNFLDSTSENNDNCRTTNSDDKVTKTIHPSKE